MIKLKNKDYNKCKEIYKQEILKDSIFKNCNLIRIKILFKYQIKGEIYKFKDYSFNLQIISFKFKIKIDLLISINSIIIINKINFKFKINNY